MFTQATVGNVDVSIAEQVGVGVVALPPALYGPVAVEAVTQLGTGKGDFILRSVLVVVITDVDPVFTDVATEVKITSGISSAVTVVAAVTDAQAILAAKKCLAFISSFLVLSK